MKRSPLTPARNGIAVVTLALSSGVILGHWFASRVEREKADTIHRALVDVLLNVLSSGDVITERHSRRVADLTDELARFYGLPTNRHSRLRLAALLHDMGKIDDRFFAILHGSFPLDREARTLVARHPGESATILKPLERIHPGITGIVEAHHESWNGEGYPRGLKGEDIPLEARLISVADVFDALTQPRPYREPASMKEAIAEIRKGAGTRFDPKVVALLDSPRLLQRWRRILEDEPRARQGGSTGNERSSNTSDRRGGRESIADRRLPALARRLLG